MSGWRQEPFEAVIADESSGNVKTPQSEFLPSGRYPIVDQGKALVAGYTDDEVKLCRAELPLIVFGDHTRCFKYVDFPFCVGADGVKVLRPRNGNDAKYLYHYLRQLSLTEGGYDRHFKYLRRCSVAVPPLAEQRRIAAILDKADALRVKRRTSLAKLESVTQAIFLDMFGDPATNPKQWPTNAIGELAARISDGPFGSNLKSEHYTESGVRVVRLQNIGVDEFIDDDAAYVSERHFAKLKKHECLPGDVLVGTLGDPNLRACIQPAWLRVALNKADCVQIRPNDRLANAAFLCALLNQPATERMAQGLMLGQTRVRISMGRLRGLSVPVPPLALQREFESRVTTVGNLKAAQVAADAKAANLFSSIQSRAFRGEL
jgi:type I restriction enzyme S subunit